MAEVREGAERSLCGSGRCGCSAHFPVPAFFSFFPSCTLLFLKEKELREKKRRKKKKKKKEGKQKEKKPRFLFLCFPRSPSPRCGLLFGSWRDRDEEMFLCAWQGAPFMS